MPTGFNAYHLYNVVKYMHFNSRKYDVTRMGLPRKEQFLRKWNDEMVNRKESLLFLKLDKLYGKDRDALARLYAHYYMSDPRFYVTTIFDDEMRTHRELEAELGMMKDVVERDFLSVAYLARTNGKGIREIMREKGRLPLVFSIYDRGRIGVHGLLAFHLAWNIGEFASINARNVVEEEKTKKYRAIIDKYFPMVHKYYDFDVKQFISECYRKTWSAT